MVGALVTGYFFPYHLLARGSKAVSTALDKWSVRNWQFRGCSFMLVCYVEFMDFLIHEFHVTESPFRRHFFNFLRTFFMEFMYMSFLTLRSNMKTEPVYPPNDSSFFATIKPWVLSYYIYIYAPSNTTKIQHILNKFSIIPYQNSEQLFISPVKWQLPLAI